MTPIVLHHGLFGFGNFKLGPVKLSYFHKIDNAIARLGHPLILTRVHPTGSVTLRAHQLKHAILSRLNGSAEKVIVLAHSMGGLDARHMITHLGMADRVSTLVTISCPHRGSPYADWCVRHVGTRLRLLTLMKSLGVDAGAFHDLTLERCARFNETTPDAPAVKYYSISACRPWPQVPPWAMHAWRVIHAAEGENDGLVSVQSAQWGEHLGTWPADHWHTINKRFAMEGKEKTGDITPYYLRMLERVVGGVGDRR